MGRIQRIAEKNRKRANQDPTSQALLYLHIAVFLWGFTGVLGKAVDLNAFMLVVYRMIMTALIYYSYLRIRRIPTRLSAQAIRKLGLIGTIMGIHWVAFYGAIKLANISVAMVCLATSSLFTIFLEALWKRSKPSRIEVFLGILALMGVTFVYIDNLEMQYGLLAGLFAAALSSFFNIMNKDVIQEFRPSQIAFYELLVGGLVLLLFVPVLFLAKEPVQLIPDWESFFYLFLLAFFCTFIGQVLALESLKVLNPFTLALTVNLETFYGIILAFVFYKEHKLIGTNFYIGSTLIISSVLIQSIYIRIQNRKKRKSLPGFDL